jgi:hypothetical protein
MIKDLDKFILKGIVTDLFKAERALSVVRAIGKHSKSINEHETSIKATLSYFQNVSLNEFVLSLARIYDKPSRNKTRCLEVLIGELRVDPTSFPKIIETHKTIEHLQYFKMPPNLVTLLKNEENSKFTHSLGDVFYNDFLNLINQRKIIKDWRDKILAHNDQNNKVENIKLNNTETLLEFAWKVITIVGWAYLSTAYGIMGDNSLKRDAQIQAFHLNRTIEKLLNERTTTTHRQ